jgi:hypothetical protein
LLLPLVVLVTVAPEPTAGPSAPPSARPPSLQAAGSSGAGASATEVGAEMRNVDFHIDSGIVLSIKRLRGALVPTHSGVPPRLDDKLSYVLEIHSAAISIDTASLTTLLNRHVFGYRGSPLKRLRVTVDGDQLIQTGLMHKGVDMPFRIRAAISVTPDGQIRMHPTAVKVMGLNAAGVMNLFGVHIGGLITLEPGHGARIEKDDFILDPTAILPPPAIRGHLTAIGVANGGIAQTFGAANEAASVPSRRPQSVAPNYMYFHGNTLRFGKLTMVRADLEIVDNDPSNPFDYDPNRYDDHLVAGWSQTTAAAGLIVHMPDLRLLPAKRGR